MHIRKSLKRFGLSDRGATAIEYGLIAALVSVAIIAAIRLTGSSLKNVFGNINNALTLTGN